MLRPFSVFTLKVWKYQKEKATPFLPNLEEKVVFVIEPHHQRSLV